MDYKVGSVADMISASSNKSKNLKPERSIIFEKVDALQPSIKKGKKRKGEAGDQSIIPKIKKLNNGLPVPGGRPKRPKKKKKEKKLNVADQSAADNEVEKVHRDLDPEQESRTIFVGNLIKSTTKYNLKNLFSKYGKVETVRLRSAPVADPRVSKKVAVIKGEFHPDRTNINAYVRFESGESAHSALAANGMVINDHTIRVDMAAGSADNCKKAVFVGNIKFTVTEEDLRKVFQNCGEIHSIRVVRDPRTGMGKGFAFINFEGSEAVELALQLDGEELEKRALRVTRCNMNEKKGKMKGKSNGVGHAGQGSEKTGKKKKKLKAIKGEAPVKSSENVSHGFQGQLIADKNVKKTKKQKLKRKKNEQKKKVMLHKLEMIPKSKKEKTKKKASNSA